MPRLSDDGWKAARIASIVLAAAAAVALAAGAALTGGSAMAAGDPDAGAKVFRKCKACHALEAGTPKLGPHLDALIGRRAGSVPGFRYSKAMSGSGIVWDEKSLDAFLAKPRKLVPGTRMAFAGLKKKRQRDDLIAYLRKATR